MKNINMKTLVVTVSSLLLSASVFAAEGQKATQAELEAEAAARMAADAAETSARIAADSAETSARVAGDAAEASARVAGDAAEASARVAGDAAEASARMAADSAETSARIAGDAAEASARTSADAGLQDSIDALVLESHGFYNYVKDQEFLTSAGDYTITAHCDEGDRAISGGVFNWPLQPDQFGAITIFHSASMDYGFDEGDSTTGWRSRINVPQSTIDFWGIAIVSATVMCADYPPYHES